MAEDDLPSIPEVIQPDPEGYRFDLVTQLHSVVSVRTRIPDDALTAPMLGTERSGHGVVVNDSGVILTIGYVVTEAESVWLVTHNGTTVPGHVMAYDQQSGFGLVQAFGQLDLAPMPMGTVAELAIGQAMILAGAGGTTQCVTVQVAGMREFAGYWEYLLDNAIFTVPAHPLWGGAALIGEDGKLYGIGSLMLETVDQDGDANAANMVIPIDLLLPILDELLRYGTRSTPARPWIGWFIQETRGGLIVAGVVDDGPADLAGLESGDIVLGVDGISVDNLPALYRAIWSSGDAGVAIVIDYRRDGESHSTSVTSTDRNQLLKTASVH